MAKIYLYNITYRKSSVSMLTLHGESGEDGSYSTPASFVKLNEFEDRLVCNFMEDIIFHC